MSRVQAILVVLLVLLGAFVAILAMRNRQPPVLPVNEDHAIFVGAAGCLVCHGPEGGMPRSRNHPLGEDCVRCHGRR